MQPNPKSRAKGGLVVSSAQLRNPLVSLKQLAHETSDKLIFDFLFTEQSTGIVFLSLRYHYQNPIYIQSRVQELRNSEEFRGVRTALLCVVLDREDSNDRLVDLQMLRFEIGLQTLLVKSGKQFTGLLKGVLRQGGRQDGKEATGNGN